MNKILIQISTDYFFLLLEAVTGASPLGVWPNSDPAGTDGRGPEYWY